MFQIKLWADTIEDTFLKVKWQPETECPDNLYKVYWSDRYTEEMEYKCVDRGSARCPCALMEAGQCYTCTMSRKGKCDCSVDWQGVCPYN